MTTTGRARSIVATLIGYVIVAIIAFWLLGAVIGTIRWLLRIVVMLVLLAALLTAYLRLKTPRSR